jgi:hypothetical protein
LWIAFFKLLNNCDKSSTLDFFWSLQCRILVAPMPYFWSLQCRGGRSNAVGWSLQCRGIMAPQLPKNAVLVDNFPKKVKK